jgi:hypothetical protein
VVKIVPLRDQDNDHLQGLRGMVEKYEGALESVAEEDWSGLKL